MAADSSAGRVEQLRPGTHGHNLVVKVLHSQDGSPEEQAAADEDCRVHGWRRIRNHCIHRKERPRYLLQHFLLSE
jgi:hypothetical protein